MLEKPSAGGTGALCKWPQLFASVRTADRLSMVALEPARQSLMPWYHAFHWCNPGQASEPALCLHLIQVIRAVDRIM